MVNHNSPILHASPLKSPTYKPGVDLNVLAAKASQIFGKQLFRWQLDITLTILCGKDVIVDVGTGSRKTKGRLCNFIFHLERYKHESLAMELKKTSSDWFFGVKFVGQHKPSVSQPSLL
jgi:hypothetical protein